jgi:S-adenosyl-L-methionine hydrolase (adenosine-forming)
VVITFLSDFGFQDEYVGTCHGVIKQIAPEAEVIDITHGIAPQRVLQGALVLERTLPYMPAGVHLAVVDPGVGGQRRALALRSGDGRFFVGPDNGLLVPAAENAGGIEAVHELTNAEYALPSVSRTFHGRDLFAPAAAHIALGVALERLGPPVAQDALARLDLPTPTSAPGRIEAAVLAIDRFGNIQLNLTRDDMRQKGLTPGTKVELEHLGERYYAVVARTFADARAGDVILYEDAFGWIAVAISEGNAGQLFAVAPGESIVVHLGTP